MIRIYLLVIFTLAIFGCAASRPAEPSAPESKPVKKAVATTTSTTLAFDPVKTGPDVFSEILDKSPSPPAQETTVSQRGYRIQIGAYIDQKVAQRAMDEAQKKFDEAIYLQFDAPFHRIRIGNCKTMQQADSLKEIAIKSGYSDAVVTNDEIIAEK